MGGSSHSGSVTSDYLASHKRAGTDPFIHTAAVASGLAPSAVHALLDPKGKNKAGVIVRESRDSDAHPNSRAVVVMFDNTGSMQDTPRIFMEKLPQLMALLVSKAYVPDPHILFGSINDAPTMCVAPLQVGQFEAGNEMDAAITHTLLQGNGGGTNQESYELAMWFLAQYAEMDCLTKRGEKGLMFIIGDEVPYDRVRASEVKQYVGVDIQHDIPTLDVLEQLREKFEVFWILPGQTQNWHNSHIIGKLQNMFGQRFLKLPDPNNICELIATTIGVAEGHDVTAVADDLKAVGADASAVASSVTALATYTGSGKAVKRATMTGKLPVPAGKDAVGRL